MRLHLSLPNVPREDLSRIILKYYSRTPRRVEIRDKHKGYRYDHFIHVQLVGDPEVGKSILVMRIFNNSYFAKYIPTIHFDYKRKIVKMNDTKLKVQIWDTSGGEMFRALTPAIHQRPVQRATGILHVYDMTNEESFLNLANWIQFIDQYAHLEAQRMLIGNKCDLVDDQVIAIQRGQELADEYDMKFFATSAKTDTNVLEAFVAVVEDVFEEIRDQTAKREEPEKKRCVVL